MIDNKLRIIVRDLDKAFVVEMQRQVREQGMGRLWDVQLGNVLEVQEADFIISPGNQIGRMDGGVDGAYTRKFGQQLSDRLMFEIANTYDDGRLPIGQARAILTHHPAVPVFVCAPTMNWPPHQVRGTQNAYLAFQAGLHAVRGLADKMVEPKVLTTGFCTLTGNMEAREAARQMMQAYKEVCL